MRYKFLFSIFVFFFISVFLALGSWQIIRLNWKLELINQIETSLKDIPVNLSNSKHKNYLRVKTRGSIDFEKQIYLYNLNEKGKPGFEVINPLKVGNNNYLLNRGWIPFNKKEDETINVIDENYINGVLRKQIKPNIFKPENDLSENYWFTLDRDDIFKFTGKNFSPYVIYLSGNNEFPKPKSITANISNNHKKYALTWFSLAISILLIYLYLRKKNY
ncbi:SURF1 family protein [Candidatus Pelagibacter ubique]|uniref:SURF1-like protein n=1 Tax=Pelagibacter ubique (strain HTCC1062) TaxID=335992 RepID=Q4FPD6_PELUB|nr:MULTISPECIES: SURF1 family protein [Pelagibacter]MDA7444036.1 SURF1 family protein [Candidatus Pelagibacter ubique]AAZ20953.1 surfeit locus protein 1 [Candidatus Pelagibacter ubique HTCC1062]MDA7444910.1 SURF1 family protein [Candidatus Pelagibacter ubique]MDA7447392.1 SURF1 family protein [Candidatus Pelagibacter ubique]MDA7453798.1 SURF1 family protein [Candidatus Pelagibacter ubique]